MQTHYKFLRFIEQPAKGKGRIWWRCVNNSAVILGEVVWFPKWERHVYQPNINAVYDQKCLEDIAAFLSQLAK